MTAATRVGDAVLALMRRYGHEFIGVQETQGLLESLERTHPALVREVVPKLVSPILLADVLRRLVEEGVSLRNLRDVLGALAEWAPHERDPVALVEKNADAIRGRTFVRIAVGAKDRLLPVNTEYHELLTRLKIEHSFDIAPDAIHSTPQVYDGLGDKSWEFYMRAFGSLRQ